MLCSLITSAISSRSSLSIIAPVGLFGNGSTRSFVFGVIAARRSDALSLKLSSFFVLIITGTPSAITVSGS